MAEKHIDEISGVETTGHEWDGIRGLNNPMPRWWVWVFYLTIIWGIGYTVAYPAWPLITAATPGMLGASTRADVAADIARFDAQNAEVKAKLVATDLGAIAQDQDLNAYAMQAGKSVFMNNCAQCHSAGGQGVVAGIDEVRPGLEGLHAESPPDQGGHQAQADGRLAAPAARSRDDYGFHGVWRRMVAERAPEGNGARPAKPG